MKKLITLIAIMCCTVAAMAQFASAPAFPGAEGYGRYVTGGRGGMIYHVTSLQDVLTNGTLRYGIERVSGARTIVFDVGGTINLTKDLTISNGNGNISILGQTAPGDGICLAGYPVKIATNNVIMRYVRCRMGDTSGEEEDALTCSNHAGSEKRNIIIDHCSISWCVDECASFYGNSNFTFQWNMVTESLRNSIHGKGSHGYGGIWGGTRASFHHNLLAHHDSRNARFDHDYVQNADEQYMDYVNNAFYNWGGNNTYGGESKGKGGTHYRKINFVGNYYKPGPATGSASKAWIFNMTNNCSNCDGSDPTNVEPAHLYLTGNIMEGNDAINADNWTGIHPDIAISDFTPYKSDTKYLSPNDTKFVGYNTITVQPADVSFNKILLYAGCSKKRDIIDNRICTEARNGSYTYTGSNGSTGGLIDTQSDVGGWPTLTGGANPTDSDGDGMPDEWETLNGLDPNDADDGEMYTLDAKGYYTNSEVYFNSLVEDMVKAERADASETFTEYYPAYKCYKDVTTITPVASGTVTLNFASEVQSSIEDYTPVASSSLSSYIDSSEASNGENLSSLASTCSDLSDVKLLQIKNTEVCTGSDDDAVTFSFSSIDGYQFRVTGANFYAGKNGTNTDTSVSATVNTTSLAAGQAAPRITSGGAAANNAYHYSNNALSLDPAGTITFTAKYNGGAATKTVCLSDVILNVEAVTVVTERKIVDVNTGISEVKTAVSPAAKKVVKVFKNGQILIGNYNIAGQRVR